MEVIRTDNLTKRYGNTMAVDDISIRVNKGEIYGFLGLNGAGKTTLIRALLGMVKPDNGTIHLFGSRLNARFNHWNDIGYLVESPSSYPNLSVYENLQVLYKLRQLTDPTAIDSIIEHLKLTTSRNTKAMALSLGNQQRLGLAKALMHKPKLLLLDEPINGLDPRGIVEVRELLIELAKSGSTIFLSSHILGEISKLAHRIAIIHEGKLIKELTTQELSTHIIRKVLVQTTDNPTAVRHLVDSNYPAVMASGNDIEITGEEALQHPERISKLLTEKGLPPTQVYQYTEDLEMFFLRTIDQYK